jgi:hypothetical protein
MTGDCCPPAGGQLLACCSAGAEGGGTMSGEFEVLILADRALVDKVTAWSEMLAFQQSPGVGASRANYLLWTASRPPTKWNNASAQDLKLLGHRAADSSSIRPECSANSGCGALGN